MGRRRGEPCGENEIPRKTKSKGENADARVGWVRRFGRVPTTCWPMRRIWPNAKFGKSNEGTRFFLSLFLSLVFLWRLTVYRDFSKERGLFSLSTRIYIYLFQLFNKVYKKSCRYWYLKKYLRAEKILFPIVMKREIRVFVIEISSERKQKQIWINLSKTCHFLFDRNLTSSETLCKISKGSFKTRWLSSKIKYNICA